MRSHEGIMKALLCKKHGGPDVLVYEGTEALISRIARGKVVIDVRS